MTSISSKLDKVKDALVNIKGLTVKHYFRSGLTAPYCIWAEDGEGKSLHGNNKKLNQSLSGTVDLFTKSENDPFADSIQEALNDAENVAWYLNSVQREEETELVHYEWVFEVS